MRLWSLHPEYLDRQGLTALWREALLAQAVLRGRTHGYRSHPQLRRFQESGRPLSMISAYLRGIWEESRRRGYRFEAGRILGRPGGARLALPRGQLVWEWGHLCGKLRRRSPDVYERWSSLRVPRPHPLFRQVPGGRADWERGAAQGS